MSEPCKVDEDKVYLHGCNHAGKPRECTLFCTSEKTTFLVTCKFTRSSNSHCDCEESNARREQESFLSAVLDVVLLGSKKGR